MAALSINPSFLTFGAKSGSKEVTVFSSANWQISGGEPWCEVSLHAGSDQAVVRFTASANDQPEARTAKFVFTAGSQSVYFEVRQEAGRTLAMLDHLVPAYMEKNNVPAVSLAITYKERLVYLNTFGYQDLDNRVPATNDHIFRIASITKVLTLVGILKLVEQGKLTVDDKVLGDHGILGFDFGGQSFGSSFADSRMIDITVDHLIQHKSGWIEPPLDLSKTLDEFITNAVTNVPLRYAPGTEFQYSNFDYILLWEIIEKVAQQCRLPEIKTV